MMFFDIFIGIFAIFVSPQIFIYYKFEDAKYSLVLAYGLIVSFSFSWILFLIGYWLNLGGTVLFQVLVFTCLSSLLYLFTHKNTRPSKNYIIWAVALVALTPLSSYVGMGYTEWDGIVSWNRWAIELSSNNFKPFNAAYPVLLPSLWSLIYKIQGTSEIWWTGQLTLFVFPIITLVILLTLFLETKNKTFIFIAIFLYPFLIWWPVFGGGMDMPVMLMGILSLVMAYTAEIQKENKDFAKYAFAAILTAGISTIIKQSGFAFLIFNFIFALANLKSFPSKKTLLKCSLGSLLYFSSFLVIFFQIRNNPISNLGHLKELSEKRIIIDRGFWELYEPFWDQYFFYPPRVDWLDHLLAPEGPLVFAPYLIGIALALFFFKGTGKFRSVSFLSAIFFFLGVILWVKFFSYDTRNSYWTKAFYITFVSINLNFALVYIIKTYKSLSQNKPKLIFDKKHIALILIIGAFIYAFNTPNQLLYEVQAEYQKNLGRKILAQRMNRLLKDSDKCTLMFTNREILTYNHYLKRYRDQVIYFGYQISGLLKEIKHDCKDGRYFVIHPRAARQPGWKLFVEAKNKGLIKLIGTRNHRIYYVPPSSDYTAPSP
ncbi:MAG: hypothetical protein QNL04_07480 [SAR324 cluster bacterium]|nr:hypothetical protein [SAR324 cluster bacterium]